MPVSRPKVLNLVPWLVLHIRLVKLKIKSHLVMWAKRMDFIKLLILLLLTMLLSHSKLKMTAMLSKSFRKNGTRKLKDLMPSVVVQTKSMENHTLISHMCRVAMLKLKLTRYCTFTETLSKYYKELNSTNRLKKCTCNMWDSTWSFTIWILKSLRSLLSSRNLFLLITTWTLTFYYLK